MSFFFCCAGLASAVGTRGSAAWGGVGATCVAWWEERAATSHVMSLSDTSWLDVPGGEGG